LLSVGRDLEVPRSRDSQKTTKRGKVTNEEGLERSTVIRVAKPGGETRI